ncbi:MAG: SusC/RagA family TonB-linked outer membrane protein [Gloeobacteraceae cyanobacterium ES-bin-316]|nr:SusC/RagA family TonB-linked outer membrane protein [Ferruginibacter sp.]
MIKLTLLKGNSMPHSKLFVFFFCLFLSVNVSAQQKYSFDWKKSPVSQVFSDIEKKAKVTFAYNPSEVSIYSPISLNVRGATIDEVVAAVCKKVNAVYKISGNTIMIQGQSKAGENNLSLGKEFILTGKIIDANNDDVAGATVTSAGFSRSTLSKENGAFTLKIKEGELLTVTKIGYKATSITAAIGDKIVIVELATQALDLNPVVITALGIRRETRSLGYAVGTVEGSDINKARETNVINSLAGKVAGLIINSTAGGPAGSSKVIIRGSTEITGNNQPLYVVDGVPMDNSNYGQVGSEKYSSGYDFGDAISAINPDDIETISVLKGPSASALYGSRAGHGVILITTKKGGPKKSLGIEFNSTSTVEKLLTRFDDYQYEYGQGTGGTIPRDATQARLTMFSNFGAKLDASLLVPGFDGTTRSYGLIKNNIENFFRSGTTFTNNVAMTTATDNTTFRLSVSDLRNNDIVPGSKMVRNTINLRGTSKFGKRLSIDAKGIYVKENVTNRPGLADDPSNIGNNFLGLANNIDQDIFEKGYKDASGNYIDWGGGQYRLNPYWVINDMKNTTKKDRLLSSLQANYVITDWLSLQGRLSYDVTNLDFMKYSPRTTPGSLLGRIEGIKRTYNTTEADLLLSAQKQISPDIYLSGRLGASMSHQKHPGTVFQGTDMQITDAIAFNSFKDKLITDELYQKRINSFYGLFSVGYKGYLYLDATVRRDASSTLIQANNTYVYPSLSGSFIFTDAFNITNKNILSFGKLRVSAAEVGSDTDPYKLNLYYGLNERPFQGQSVGGIATLIKPNPDLVPTRTRSFEVGTELRFLKNRLTVDFTYYTQKSRDQINNVPLPVSSGFGQQIINAGVVSNAGVELLLSGTPLKSKDFEWNVSVNYAHNKNTVNTLADGVPFLVLSEARWLGVSVVAMPGAAYGAILGYDFKYDDAGNKILDPVSLKPLATDERKVLGKGTWDWTGGMTNTLHYKNFGFNAVIDVKVGADLFSMTNMYAILRGSDISTLEGRQEWISSEEQRIAEGKTIQQWDAEGKTKGYVPNGVIQTGLDANGKPVYTQNTRAMDPGLYWGNFYSDDRGILTPFLYDASYVKMRELMLSYNIPAKLFGKLKIAAASFSVVSRNPFIIHKSVPNVDPDSNYNNGNGQGFEYGSLPSRRSWGLNLNVRF